MSGSVPSTRSAVRSALEFCQADLHGKIRDKVAILHEEEERMALDAEEAVS